MSKKFIAGFIAGAITFSSLGAFAASGKAIEVFYSIKDIKINNVSQLPEQKPFTYDGTTFVPLRFIADKLDQPIKYDAKTQTIFIGAFDGEQVYIGNGLQITNEKEKQLSIDSVYEKSAIKDVLGNEYNKYILFNYKTDDYETPSGEFEVLLNGKYEKFKGTIAFTENATIPDKPVIINIYADDKRIYAGVIEPGALPRDVNLDVKNARTLKVSTKTDSQKGTEIALFDAHLVKSK